MKLFNDEELITEICGEGVELSYEFECAHNKTTSLIWSEIEKEYLNENVKRVQNIYHDTNNYRVVLVGHNDVKTSFDIPNEFFENLYDSIVVELTIK